MEGASHCSSPTAGSGNQTTSGAHCFGGRPYLAGQEHHRSPPVVPHDGCGLFVSGMASSARELRRRLHQGYPWRRPRNPSRAQCSGPAPSSLTATSNPRRDVDIGLGEPASPHRQRSWRASSPQRAAGPHEARHRGRGGREESQAAPLHAALQPRGFAETLRAPADAI